MFSQPIYEVDKDDAVVQLVLVLSDLSSTDITVEVSINGSTTGEYCQNIFLLLVLKQYC